MEGMEYGSCNVHSNLQPSICFFLYCWSWTARTLYPKLLCSYFSRCDLGLRIRCTAGELEFHNEGNRKEEGTRKASIFLVHDVAEEFIGLHPLLPWFGSFLQSWWHLPNYGRGSVVLSLPVFWFGKYRFPGQGQNASEGLMVSWQAH